MSKFRYKRAQVHANISETTSTITSISGILNKKNSLITGFTINIICNIIFFSFNENNVILDANNRKFTCIRFGRPLTVFLRLIMKEDYLK